MPDVQARSRAAHQKAVEFNVADIARFLQETLGQKLVAYIAKVADHKAVGDWAKGLRVPRPESEQRLRTAFHVFHLLQNEGRSASSLPRLASGGSDGATIRCWSGRRRLKRSARRDQEIASTA
jgi:hypothetical protein